jgi:hypothetical protein
MIVFALSLSLKRVIPAWIAGIHDYRDAGETATHGAVAENLSKHTPPFDRLKAET